MIIYYDDKEFNNDMQYKIKARCEELGIKVFLTKSFFLFMTFSFL